MQVYSRAQLRRLLVAKGARALALWRSIADEIPRTEYRAGESIYFDLPIARPVRRGGLTEAGSVSDCP